MRSVLRKMVGAARGAPPVAATLTGASIWFATHDADKDVDSILAVYLMSSRNVQAAGLEGTLGHFDDNSTHGPYAMNVTPGIKIADFNPAVVRMEYVPIFHDTWRFDYSITMTFSDGTSFVFGQTGKTLSESFFSFEAPFNLVSPARGPKTPCNNGG